MSELRIWHAARDPYHCAFRMIRLLTWKGDAMPLDHLRVLDMLLMYPSLAWRMKLPSAVRDHLRALRLPAVKDLFVSLPGTASIWQDLHLYQSTALKQLAGRSLLKRDALRDRYAALDQRHMPVALSDRVDAENSAQAAFMTFLIEDIASLPATGSDNIFKRAGVPARGPVA
ncbi:ABC-three component system middle component 5 [Sphingomonas phyllosphaerae]|uniref:ABC-three component system middle component 5 n=1 Tax=Sphingomonas phyllosphaerae TaxID=257003 RepID=UPI00055C7D60|nr:ABC-three component system middle component 5 [Sphingomonas phyllosphaerae]